MMHKQIFTALLFIIIECNFTGAQSPLWSWSKGIGSADYEIISDVTTDVNGNITVVGAFTGPQLTIGSYTLTTTSVSDMFIAQYDASGNVLWANSYGGNNSEYPYSVSSDPTGNLIVAGIFDSDSISFGSVVLVNTVARSSFIAKFDASGNVIWANAINGGDAHTITSDDSGNISVAGQFYSTLYIDTLVFTNTGGDVFIAHYNPSGQFQWAKTTSGNFSDNVSHIHTDFAGNIIVAGSFNSPVFTIDTVSLNNNGFGDMYLLKYTETGSLLWAKTAGGTNSDWANSVDTDTTGNIYLAGEYVSPAISFDTISFSNSFHVPQSCLIKYTPSGSVEWVFSTSSSTANFAHSVVIDANGNLFIGGTYIDTNLILGSDTLTNQGDEDIYVAKFNAAGNPVWAKSVGGINTDLPENIALHPSGDLVVAGWFESPALIFDSHTLINQGFNDCFVSKLGSTTGLMENESEDFFTLGPNPFSSHTTIHFLKEISNATVHIIDAEGRVVKNSDFSGSSFTINKADIKAGIYFIYVFGENINLRRKIVVQ